MISDFFLNPDTPTTLVWPEDELAALREALARPQPPMPLVPGPLPIDVAVPDPDPAAGDPIPAHLLAAASWPEPVGPVLRVDRWRPAALAGMRARDRDRLALASRARRPRRPGWLAERVVLGLLGAAFFVGAAFALGWAVSSILPHLRGLAA